MTSHVPAKRGCTARSYFRGGCRAFYRNRERRNSRVCAQARHAERRRERLSAAPQRHEPDYLDARIHSAYEDFCRRVDSNEETDLDPYAAESPGEFFAVLSESFFVQPRLVVASYSDVYQQLKLFYRQDRWRSMNVPGQSLVCQRVTRMKKRASSTNSRRSLAAGFGALLILIAAITLLGVSRIYTINQHIEALCGRAECEIRDTRVAVDRYAAARGVPCTSCSALATIASAALRTANTVTARSRYSPRSTGSRKWIQRRRSALPSGGRSTPRHGWVKYVTRAVEEGRAQ
jgi:hypothetical protein